MHRLNTEPRGRKRKRENHNLKNDSNNNKLICPKLQRPRIFFLRTDQERNTLHLAGNNSDVLAAETESTQQLSFTSDIHDPRQPVAPSLRAHTASILAREGDTNLNLKKYYGVVNVFMCQHFNYIGYVNFIKLILLSLKQHNSLHDINCCITLPFEYLQRKGE